MTCQAVRAGLLIAIDGVLLRLLTQAVPTDVDLLGLSDWLARTPPDDAVIAVVAATSVALAWWVGIGLALYVLATATKLRGLARAVGWAVPRPLRRLVDSSLLASVVVSVVPVAVPAAPAAAHVAVPVAAARMSMSEVALSGPSTDREHIVVPGEYLSLIARNQTGDGNRWPELCADNRGVMQPDGRALDDCDLIRPGWRLRVRGGGAPQTPPPAAPREPSPPSPAPASPPTGPQATVVPLEPTREAPTPAPAPHAIRREKTSTQPLPLGRRRSEASLPARPTTTTTEARAEPPTPPVQAPEGRPGGGDAVAGLGAAAAVFAVARALRRKRSSIDGHELPADQDGTPDDRSLSEPLHDASEAERAEIYVRVMGPVEIEGTEGELARAKSVEFVAYLAIHPRGEDADRLMEALWPEKKPVSTTFNTTVSVARGALGTNAAGEHHVSHVERGRYRVQPSVQTDWAVLRATVRRVEGIEDPLQRLDLLCTALELVRGEPFDGCRKGYEWARKDGTASNVEREIVEAAAQAAELALGLRQGKVARWAARQGLLASPGSELLYRWLMEAAGKSGDRAEVERVMDELCSVRETSDLGELEGPTADLYKRLTGRGEARSA